MLEYTVARDTGFVVHLGVLALISKLAMITKGNVDFQ